MQLKKKELLKVWDKVKLVAKKGSLLFTGYDLVAFSQEFIVACPFETDFKGSVSHQEFIGLLQKAKSDNVMASCSDRELHLKAHGVKAVIKIDPDDYMLDLVNAAITESQDDQGWYVLRHPESFRCGINLCANYASTRLEQVIAYVLIADNRIVSTDDFRISCYELQEQFDGRMLIRAPNCKLLTKFKFDQYAIKDKWVYFADPADTLIAVKSTGIEYVEIDQHMDFKGEQITLPETFVEKLDQISPFFNSGKDIEKVMLISLEKGRIVLHAEKDLGWAETICPAKKLNPKHNLNISINPAYLAEILKITGNTLKLGEDRALFKKDNFSHLLGLARV